MRKIFIILSLITVLTASGCSGSTLTLKGDIQNNILPAVSTVSGKITQMNKKQGEPVKKGDIIAVIDNTSQQYAVMQMQAVVDMKRAKLEELKAGTREEQIASAEAQVRAAQAQLDQLTAGSREEQIRQGENGVSIALENAQAAQENYDYQKKQVDNAQALFDLGGLSQNELDGMKLMLEAAAHQLALANLQTENEKQKLALLKDGSTAQAIEGAKANVDAANAQLSLLVNGATEKTIEAAQADLDQSVAQLKQAQYTLENCNIKASSDGIIISKNFELGDVVNIGNDIAEIAVAEDLYVLCYIPDRYLDRIVYNQALTVQTSEGDLTGRVSYIALRHEYTPKDLQSTSDRKHTATKIKVAFTEEKGILKSGMTAKVLVPLQ